MLIHTKPYLNPNALTKQSAHIDSRRRHVSDPNRTKSCGVDVEIPIVNYGIVVADIAPGGRHRDLYRHRP